MKLNLGCGNKYMDGFVNVDMNDEVKCDVVCDLENDIFPWADNSVEYINAEMILEHIWKRDRFMNECWRVLKPGCQMFITVPPAGTVAYYKDPTHISPWIPQTFKYYAEWNTDKANKRKTWKILQNDHVSPGDENEFLEVIMQKPDENLR